MAAQGHLIGALMVLLGFHLYLRPRELKTIQWKQWAKPMGRHMGGSSGWTLTLHAQEDGVTSK
eukprot:10280089-Karenia_brevis.AAC.1